MSAIDDDVVLDKHLGTHVENKAAWAPVWGDPNCPFLACLAFQGILSHMPVIKRPCLPNNALVSLKHSRRGEGLIAILDDVEVP